MILPSKYVNLEGSLLGLGAVILAFLTYPRTITSLWEEVRKSSDPIPFSYFVLALDLLFIMGAIDLNEGLVTRRKT
jgi:hypothetical protein